MKEDLKKKIEGNEVKEKVLARPTNAETQTDHTETETIGTNTGEDFDKLEDKLEIDSNGKINVKENEAIIEMKTSHTFNNWEQIDLHIQIKIELTLIWKPWIAKNGRQFMTFGFRTFRRNYEHWKIETFNWQESGLQSVASSSLYR